MGKHIHTTFHLIEIPWFCIDLLLILLLKLRNKSNKILKSNLIINSQITYLKTLARFSLAMLYAAKSRIIVDNLNNMFLIEKLSQITKIKYF